MISIVIPTFNEEKVIEKTLRQFLPYKRKFALEIIVADARSTDATVRIARKLADRVIVEKKRSNIPTGRNLGAFAANGELIIELDADSRIGDPDLFFRTVQKIFRSPQIVAAMPRLRIYPEEERFEDRFFHRLINGAISFANHFGSFLSKGECQIFRKSAFNSAGGYDERLAVGEDCDLFHRLSRLGEVKYLQNLVVYHSPRRFRKEGYLRLLLGPYLLNGVALLWRHESHSKEWEPVR